MEGGHFRGPSRTLLNCSSDDQLCRVQTYEPEIIIVPVLFVGISVILLAAIFCLQYRARKQRDQEKQDAQSQQRIGHQTSTISLEDLSLESVLRTKDASLQTVEMPRENIRKPLQLVGEGRFGPIYRTVLKDPEGGRERNIIIKQLRATAEPREVRYFLNRAAFQPWLGQHAHLVDMLGCCSLQEPFYIIQENLEPGSLLNFLWDCRRDVMSMDGILYDITECQVYSIALQILSALEFLHQRNLLHGDVAARNVLIQSNFTAKLGGLGGACDMRLRGTFPSRRPAPLKWMAPERLLHLPLPVKSDIWSFGIFMYEIITLGAPPYPEIPPSNILQHLQRGNILTRPSNCNPSMYSIMKSCWAWKASDRVSLSNLRKRLEVGKKNSNDKTVLQVPELVVPELYAVVAGTEILKMEIDYTVL
ncbi:tyrosine-protein kinase STYK1 [Pelobates fuscus]|uniref:tyrosine-protein kinase STYK1 n=1 Tax=Pelobates fuscus TaxID=191477 RepID=UPI002FE4DC53